MRIERIKSFVLIILVGLSLLLTFALWSNQADYDRMYDTNYINEVDIDLGGIELTKKDIIQPNQIIFKREDKFFSFINPVDRETLYRDMQSWVLYDFHAGESDGRPDHNQFVEVIFPSPLPMEIIPSILTLNEENVMPDWSFQRIFISFIEETSSLEVQFLSVDGRNQAEAIVDKSDKYDMLLSYIQGDNDEDMDEYITIDQDGNPIYVPMEKVEAHRISLTTTMLEPEQLVNVLFTNPSLVSANVGEAYFTDGQRGMRLLENGLAIEYTNPLQSNYDRIHVNELISQSLINVNDHKGWMGTYYFESIDKTVNEIVYRMYYGGYPVFDYANISPIIQQWRNQDLYQYYRPLFILNNSLGQHAIELPSGQSVVDYLQNNAHYQLDDVEAIQIGYHLDETAVEAHSVTLHPAWYIYYNGIWRKLDLNESYSFKGGS